MARNLTEFLRHLPGEYDTWNSTYRLSFFEEELEGFSNLTTEVQQFVTSYLNSTDLSGLLPYASYGASVLNELYWKIFTTEAPPTTIDPLVICAYSRFVENYFLLTSVPAALLFMIALSFLKKRKSLWPDHCGQRPGVAIPVNFVDGRERRWAYSLVFVPLAYQALKLFEGKKIYDPVPVNLQQQDYWNERFSWVGSFVNLLNILLIAVAFYPMLACVAMRKKIAANITGILFTLYWLAINIIVTLICPPVTNGVVMKLDILIIVIMIPLYSSLLALLVVYGLDLYRNIRPYCNKKSKFKVKDSHEKEKRLKFLDELDYVREMLRKYPKPPPTTCLGKLKAKFFYRKVIGFRYSPRVVSTMVIAGMCLYKLATSTGVQVDQLFDIFQALQEQFTPTIRDYAKQYNMTVWVDRGLEYIQILHVEFVVCNYLSFGLQLIFMVHMTLCYRKHMLWLMKGKKDWFQERNISPMSEVASTFRYTGYQIAYVLYGYLIVLSLSLIIIFALTVLIFLPLRDGYSTFAIAKIKQLWPTVVVGLGIYFAQLLMARMCFCQGKGKYLALNNRRMFHVVSYLLMLFNVILGLVSCLKRILFSVVFGVLLLGRLDRNLMMRGFERFDSGFRAYLGMLTVEVYHNHPVLKAFVSIMWETYYKSQERKNMVMTIGDGKPRRMMNPAVRMKWWKAVTMSRNRGLVYERLAREAYEKPKKSGLDLADGVIELAGTAGAAVLFPLTPFSNALGS